MTKRRLSTILRMLPIAAGMAAASAMAAMPAQELPSNGPSPTLLTPAVIIQRTDAPMLSSATIAPDFVDQDATVTAPAAVPAEIQPDPAQVECIAKVIVHEAGNQPLRGQVAVAQVIRTRIKDGRFGASACGVVRQRGQFFDVDAYQPSRTDGRWATAVAIAIDTLQGEGEEVASGALFFHSAGAAMPRRVRIAQIAGHTFYR